MLISKNWLEEFIELPKSLTAKDIAHDLTMKTVEVEKINNLAKSLDKVVVGTIAKIERHPNADSLQVCNVYAGVKLGELQIVCGGTNLKENMKVALALVGAKVNWHGEAELFELKSVKLRGVESNGMICASDEIGLGEMFPKATEKEILDLSKLDVKAGTLLSNALGLDDTVYDIDNKSMTHRSDLWGHYGIARELSAFYNKKLKSINPKKISAGSGVKLQVEVENAELCPRYLGVVIDNVSVEPSPNWVQKRLVVIGVRPINNIVDITNYVMHELGQPMHAFDARNITTRDGKENRKKIIVRRAKDGEGFKTLDGKNHKLKSSDLVIADEKRAVALAGVMGGENSEIKEDTKTIIFEAASFNATSIRKTSTRLGFRTDSSARFEKTLDPELAELAMRRAVELLQKMLPNAKVVSEVVDKYPKKVKANKITLSESVFESIVGYKIPKTDIVRSLKLLGFLVSQKEKDLVVIPPTWRAVKDITIKEDVIEEIVRLFGYDKIPAHLPCLPLVVPKKNKSRALERLIKNYLSAEFGFCETYNYSFVAPSMIENIGDDKTKYIELDNPIASDRPFIRRSLLLNLLEKVESNLNRFDTVRLFEIGKTYIAEGQGSKMGGNSTKVLPLQEIMLGAVLSEKNNNNPFFAMSEAIREVFGKAGVNVEFESDLEPAGFMHMGRTAKVKSDSNILGIIGELNPVVQEKLGIPYRVAVCEINIARVLKCVKDKTEYKPLSQYPSVLRDIAFVVDKGTKHEDMQKKIKNFHPLIEDCILFDVYENEKIGINKKSMAYHIIYRSDDKTLEGRVVDEINNKIIEMLENKFKIELRK